MASRSGNHPTSWATSAKAAPLAVPPIDNTWAAEGDEQQQDNPSFQRENEDNGSDYDSDSDDSSDDDGDSNYTPPRANAPATTPTTEPTPAAPTHSSTATPTPSNPPERYNLRPQRARRAPSRYGDYTQLAALIKVKVNKNVLNQAFLNSLDWNRNDTDYEKKLFLSTELIDPNTGLVEESSPLALAVKANAADNPNWYEAMNGPLADGYWEAMETEIDTLTEKESWVIIDRQPHMNVLLSTWAFKCKRFPDGSVEKLKARFCVRGDRQKEGVDYFETYAPVVSWHTIRILLILSIKLNLSTKQVDYTAVFVQSYIQE